MLVALAASTAGVVGLTTGPASAQGTGATCQTLNLRSSFSAVGSGTASDCDNQAVTGGGGTMTFTTSGGAVAALSATVVWNSGNTSELTGNFTVVGKGSGCSASFLKIAEKESITITNFNGTVTGGNAFVGDGFNAFLCATRTGNGDKLSLVPGTSFVIG